MKNGIVITPSIPQAISEKHDAKYFGKKKVAEFKKKGFDIKENFNISREKEAVWIEHDVIADAIIHIEVTTSALYIQYTDYFNEKCKFLIKVIGCNVEYKYNIE